MWVSVIQATNASTRAASPAQIGSSGAATSLQAVPNADGSIVARGSCISGHLKAGYVQNFRQAAQPTPAPSYHNSYFCDARTFVRVGLLRPAYRFRHRRQRRQCRPWCRQHPETQGGVGPIAGEARKEAAQAGGLSASRGGRDGRHVRVRRPQPNQARDAPRRAVGRGAGSSRPPSSRTSSASSSTWVTHPTPPLRPRRPPRRQQPGRCRQHQPGPGIKELAP